MASQTEDMIAVNQLLEDYSAAWHSGDPEVLLALYADDAVVIMSHESAIIGKEALRELYQNAFEYLDNYTFTTESERKNLEVSGDLGYVWSTYTNSGTPKDDPDSALMKDHGDSLLVVRRQHDGSWRVALMMATRSNQPEAESQ